MKNRFTLLLLLLAGYILFCAGGLFCGIDFSFSMQLVLMAIILYSPLIWCLYVLTLLINPPLREKYSPPQVTTLWGIIVTIGVIYLGTIVFLGIIS